MDNELLKIAVIFTVISLVVSLLLYGALNYRQGCKRNKKKAEEIHTWSTTSALAKDWKLVEQFHRKQASHSQETLIIYQYQVEGKAYSIVVEDEGFYFNHRDPASIKKAKDDAENYARSIIEGGKPIDIYYNPNDPSESVAKLPYIGSCTPILVMVVILSVVLVISASIALSVLGVLVWGFFTS